MDTEQLVKLSSMFKSKASNDDIDLSSIDNFSYSAIMRELSNNCSDEQVESFLKIYKELFDLATENNLQQPEQVALQNTIIELSKLYKIKISKDLVKSAAISELGSAEDIGHYIANVIKFLMSKISEENRSKSLNSLKNKIMNLSPSEMSNKKMPSSAAMGQSITFVKNVLFNHDPSFIREVIKNIVKKL